MRGKALESGTEGDVVNVMNLQSKRTLSGTVIGRGQVSITPGRAPPAADQRCHLLARHTHNPRPSPSPPSVRQSLQKPSNVNVSHPSQPHHSHGRHAVAGRLAPAVVPRSTVSPQIGEKPKLTEIENPTTQPGYKPVQMPMPKPEQASYNANSLWRNGSRAFFKDQRAARIGDLLTVTVNITDKANIANETQRSRTSKEDSGDHRFHRRHRRSRKPNKILPGRS